MYSYQEKQCRGGGCIFWYEQAWYRDCSWSDGAGTICGPWYKGGNGCSMEC
ncbi:hypothetical protein Lfu02_00530 [Longispora fulva]|uniref:Uncharacterized protein n=1 Tax=Longispora fulva TaxID=619741 RepID=A0A8J7GE83_9ACTN|nr:hypothetical protein [Longispora fulva]MBG6136076.1 hypothetical protein [Longispora fulva]GIG55681.1 hypothetical protein Lfu02_00530 [Longispora fulva]